MHSYNGAYTSRLFRLLKMSGINFVANPLVNIHLQGRFDTYPKRRGITRVKEMLESGINVCFGHDDVFDPWYPLGTANMLQVLHMGLHVCQLMGYGQINDGLNLITHHSARTLNLQDYGIAAGNSANLIILPAENGFDALRRQVPVRLFGTWRQGDCQHKTGTNHRISGAARSHRLQTVIGWVTASVVYAGCGVNTLSGLRRSLKL